MESTAFNTHKRSADEVIRRALSSVREHLGMEIAYLSEIEGNTSIFRAVDAPGLEDLVKPGDRRSLDDVYCRHIVEGRLPSLIADTADIPLAASMPITAQVPIGSHVSVPIRRDDGSVYGMFCCLSPTPNPSLNARDLAIMEMFADLCADQVNGAIEVEKTRATKTALIQSILDTRAFAVVYQPIYHLGSARPSGFEALCRFKGEPYRSPDIWFAEAEDVGLGIDLELAVIDAALNGFASLPDDVYLSVNASPATATSGRLAEVFAGHPIDRIVLEITEHSAVEDPRALMSELQTWRDLGLILAIDDAGAGYSGLQQIVHLAPDILKLDMSLTSGIDMDAAKRSLAAAMVHFATEQNSIIVAEGIETEAELNTLRKIGVHRGQGWFLGKPAPLDITLCEVLKVARPKQA
ncbi:EAL domain-containing protein [Tateyamaria omphalii]|uniref:sensor domain-containing phosphodiesterase n=1 Tax=Tateyamaria omphalii TaxID=299262 RepID=UPI001C994909|nr:EAL domain-containing protein [Tateyamaria omphalii]MBY5931891.1 EAL domain-containing protein [Tateyamaria omphalii]